MAVPLLPGRPVSIAATVGATTTTITAVVKAMIVENGDEIIRLGYGDSRQSLPIQGSQVCYVEAEVVDLAALLWPKGTIASAVTLTVKGAYASNGTALTNNTCSMVLTDAVQVNDVSQASAHEGAVNPVTVKFELCKGVDGADGTYTFTKLSAAA